MRTSRTASERSRRRGTSSSASSRTSATGGIRYDGPLWVRVEVAARAGAGRSRPRPTVTREAPSRASCWREWRPAASFTRTGTSNPAAKWPHKIHVPLQTNDQVTFLVDGIGYHLPEGEAVEVNNMAVHAVENRGTDGPHPPDLRILRPRPARAGLATSTSGRRAVSTTTADYRLLVVISWLGARLHRKAPRRLRQHRHALGHFLRMCMRRGSVDDTLLDALDDARRGGRDCRRNTSRACR